MRFERTDQLMICIRKVYDLNCVTLDGDAVSISGTKLTAHTPMSHCDNVRLFICLNIQLLELRKNGYYHYILTPEDIIRVSKDVYIIAKHHHFTNDSYKESSIVIHKPHDGVDPVFVAPEMRNTLGYPLYVHMCVCNYSVAAICNLYTIHKHSKLYYAVRLSMVHPYLFLYV